MLTEPASSSQFRLSLVPSHENESLASLLLKAQNAIQAREEVLATVSHDLKNPLTTILIGAAMLDAEFPPDQQKELMINVSKAIKQAASQMRDLIDDLNDVVKIDACRFQVSKEKFQVSRLLREVLTLLIPIASQKDIVLVSEDIDEDLEIRADRKRIIQVFSNLIGNAIKFSKQGDRVELHVSPTQEFIQFSVTDTGPGIPACHLSQVFERYWQQKKHIRTGSGLGLAISKGIIDAHGGKIWVESKPGEGSTFSFKLPLSQVAQ